MPSAAHALGIYAAVALDAWSLLPYVKCCPKCSCLNPKEALRRSLRRFSGAEHLAARDVLHRVASEPQTLFAPLQYAWKPLAIKDAVDEYGSALWLDAGSTVTAPLGPAFEALHRDGHFLVQGQDMDCSL